MKRVACRGVLASSRAFGSQPLGSCRGMATITRVFSKDGVPPAGPYSPAIKANGFIFLSGQVPADSKGQLTEGSVAEKTHRMCQNAAALLKAAGSGLDKAVKVTLYFQDMGHFQEVNKVYAEYFPSKPARTSIEARRLPVGASLEMDVIALE